MLVVVMRYIASVSFGKDSLAMLLRLIKEKYPLDEVIFFDTGMEYDPIYDIRDKVKIILEEQKIKYTELHPDKSFMYYFNEHVNKDNSIGWSWCGGLCRWMTSFKLGALKKYYKTFGDETIIEYVGIASDETKRINRKRAKTIKIYPLIEWGMKENDCFMYCYKEFYDWGKLYQLLDRVSCWCCGNKNLKELKNIYLYMPKYWQKLKDLQSMTDRQFRKDYTFEQLEEKFSA